MNIPFVGKGWSFPPEFQKAKFGVKMVTGAEDIEQSLNILLSTRLGERFLHPDFGCDLSALLFEPIDLTLKTTIEDTIRNAIILYEPRIDLEEVVFTENVDEGALFINLIYLVRTTNTRTNIVYPFYLQEGSNL